MNATSGIAACCAPTARGQAATAPPSAAMNSRRRRQMLICPSRRPWGRYRGRLARPKGAVPTPGAPWRPARTWGPGGQGVDTAVWDTFSYTALRNPHSMRVFSFYAALLEGNGRRGRGCQDDVGLQAD